MHEYENDVEIPFEHTFDVQKFGELEVLRQIMAALRDPKTGCPWDIEQDFTSIAPYTIEEAYEVADAIERNHLSDLREELGDLLLQVVYHSQIAQETGAFDLTSVIKGISQKMVRRHPHVFGNDELRKKGSQRGFWEEIKAQEKATKPNAVSSSNRKSRLDDVPLPLPALKRAQKLQKKAALSGFDWGDISGVIDKLEEEIGELRQAFQNGEQDEIAEELGDLLFATTNLARHSGVDAETALRQSNHKFTRRFHYIEDALTRRGISLDDATLEDMDALWDEAKEKGL